MHTVLIHGLWYLLPDETPVRAILFGDDWRLVTRDRTPLYIVIEERVYHLVYNRDEQQYERCICDLQVDDLRLADNQ